MTTRVVLPAASPARMRQMLPFSLEDSLADDIDDLAFAVGPRDGAAVAVAVIAKERLEQWLAALAAAEVVPSAVCSEAEGVPESAGTATVVLEGPRALCRRAGEPPLAFEGLDLASVLELVLPRSDQSGGEDDEARDEEPAPSDAATATPIDKVLVYFDEAARALHAHDLARLDELGPQAEKRFMADGTLPHLAATLAQHPGTNLLQGAYAPKSNWAALARPWQLAASLAGVALLLTVVLQAAGYVSLRREDATLTEAVSAGCQRLVGTDRLAACRADVQARLRSIGAGGGGETFLPMMIAVAESLGPAMQLSGLNFRNGVLTLEVPSASVDALDRFTTAVGQTGRFAATLERTTAETSSIQVQERSQ
jgi:general secretion pathway protein L